MVRIVALGLLIAGITPTALAGSSRINIKEDAPSICKDRGSLFCSTQKKSSKADIHRDLWLQNIAETILPDSPFLVCDRRTSRVKQSGQTNLSLSSLGAIANTCGFTWQQQLNRQLTASESKPASNTSLKPKSPQKHKTILKFPSLSRSSLIVAFPQSNSTFIPRNTKLANPAPATKRIASPFGWRTRPYSNQLQFHQGIDYGAPYGSTVVSVGNGIVTRVVSGCADFGNLFCGGQLGNWIEVDHGNGIIGTYGHLKRSSISVTEGMRVAKNQPIAQVGSSGWSTGAHLDFRLKVNGKHENPAKYVMAIEPFRTE